MQLEEKERKRMSDLNQALSVIRESIGSVPLAKVQAFLTVAANEGRSQAELGKMIGVSVNTIHSYMKDLGDKTSANGRGLHLIDERVDPTEARRYEYYLSPTGQDLMRRVSQSLR